MAEGSILDELDWKILLTYDSKPFRSYNAISKIVGVHHSTVSDRIESMKSRKILRSDTNEPDVRIHRDTGEFYYVDRKKTEVIGTYSPASIGLTRVNAIFHRFQSLNDLNLMIRFVRDHNYTHYYAPLYGKGVSLFVQFDIPPNSLQHHLQAFGDLQREIIDFESFSIYPDLFEARSESDLEAQINTQHALSTDTNYIASMWDSFLENDSMTVTQPLQTQEFDNLDAELIREITINAKVNLTNLTEYYKRDKSTLSRRIKKIKNHFVDRALLVYDYQSDRLHGFQNNHIITGRFTPGSDLTTETFSKFINSDVILPFHSFTVVNDDRFLLYIRSSVGATANLMQFLLDKTEISDLNQGQYYLSQAITYPYWYGNYDENEGYNDSKEYIRDEPIRNISESV
ncbi:MAG: hypothetical protein ACXAE3_00040 [Candidatus Kariarchaeaceae archaeon]|jgi:DNA-binding Lrp family transcriptional regulator